MMSVFISKFLVTPFVRKDLERQAKKAKGTELDDGEAAAAVITALDIEDTWKKSAEGEHCDKLSPHCSYVWFCCRLHASLENLRG